jgi:hypothetical protein
MQSEELIMKKGLSNKEVQSINGIVLNTRGLSLCALILEQMKSRIIILTQELIIKKRELNLDIVFN